MRNINFALTTPQFLDGSKIVTRRLVWACLEPGTVLMACRKCRGLTREEVAKERLGPIRVLSVRRERLDAITAEDVAREDYPGMAPEAFVEMFCGHTGCGPGDEVTRIEFERIA
jgi:hypothetical protein